MAITPVGGAQNGTASSVTTISATYSPTAGNTVLVFLSTGAVTGVAIKDQLGNALTQIGTVGNTLANIWVFGGIAASGATSYVATWTSALNCALLVEEYSGVASIGAGVGNSGSTSPATLTKVVAANSFLVGAIDTRSATPATSTGTQRQIRTASSPMSALADNTSAPGGSISVVFTGSTVSWAAIAVELLAAGASSPKRCYAQIY